MTLLAEGHEIGGHYRVKRFIGKGAMADVYEAEDTFQRMPVAIKILRAQVADDSESRARFDREIAVQERIHHQNVAQLFDAGIMRTGQPYLALELLSGRTLADMMKEQGRVPPDRAAAYVAQALRGLDAIHAQGIVHRDLKPANLALQPAHPIERVVVIDFGFALLSGAGRLTQQGFVVGSLSYMAPERLRNETVDHRADVYSMAVVLYELVVGQRPFQGKDDFDLINEVLEKTPTPPGQAAPEAGIPVALTKSIMRAIAKQPGERYSSAGEFAAALEPGGRQQRSQLVDQIERLPGSQRVGSDFSQGQLDARRTAHPCQERQLRIDGLGRHGTLGGFELAEELPGPADHAGR